MCVMYVCKCSHVTLAIYKGLEKYDGIKQIRDWV